MQTLPINLTEVLVAALGLAGACFTAWIGLKLSRQKAMTDQAVREVNLQRQALDFSEFLSDWTGTLKELEVLMETTCIDRFIILRAWNGALAPRWTTAMYQLRQGIQDPVQYVHFELDTDYVDRLNAITQRGNLVFEVKDLPDSAIKEVYLAEGVTAAAWYHLQTVEANGGPSRAITYCSFATHRGGGPIPPEVLTKCLILSGRLKGVAHAFTRHE